MCTTASDTENRIRAKQNEIFYRTVELCRIAGAEPVLIEETALCAYRNAALNDYPVIAIGCEYAEKLVHTTQQSGNGLKICGIFNVPGHPVNVIEIYDPSTIDFSAANFVGRKHNCMKVRVKLIREGSHTARSKALSLEMRIYRKMRSGASKDKFGMRILRHISKADDHRSDTVKIGARSFKRAMLEETTKINVEGMPCSVSSVCEIYLEELYGATWREHSEKKYEENKNNFRDVDHSWEEYRGRLASFDTKGYTAATKAYKPLDDKFKEARDKVEANYILLERTHARIRLWKKYIGRKDDIAKMVSEGDYDNAKIELEDYINEIVRFYGDGLGLSFDPEILDAACDVLAHEGRRDFADEIKALIPEQHRETLTLLDYKGEAITRSQYTEK